MDIDIGKICRCCLSLNSAPLLTMYDGESSEGCVANMLDAITNLKPRQNDSLPEKVCLSCISEINRCYVFKIKCESSNKTLRQLIPDAACVETQQKPSQSDAAVQTEKSLRSIHVQTRQEGKAATTTQEVQTDLYFSAEFNEERKENNFDLFEDEVQSEKVESTKRGRSSPLLQSPNEKHMRIGNNEEHHFSLLKDEQQTESEETYIVVETMNNETNSSEEHELIIQNSADHESDSPRRFEYYDEVEEESAEEKERKSDNNIEDEYIYNDNANQSVNDNDYNADNSFQMEVSEIDGKSLEKEAATNQHASSSRKMRSSGVRKDPYKCPMCIMTFVSAKVLRRHITNRHSSIDAEAADEMIEKEVTPEIEMENPVGVILNDQAELNATDELTLTLENVPKPRLLPRSRSRTAPKVDEELYANFKFYCDYCQAGFAQRKTLTYHMKQNCMTSNFKCTQCDRIFISQKKLDDHSITHKGHSCLECNKICNSIEELSEHMIEVHNRNARNQCHVCKKVFTMKASLMDHLRIHSGEKPFLCTVCGKSFSQISNLRQHIMRHKNDKKFHCDECSNAYVTKAELFSHKRSHTGETPFKCNICSTCFTSSSSLQKHKRKHTGERPYSCEFCPMRFSSLNVLKNHRRTHTGERPYQCNHCDKTFTQKGDCLLHQRRHEVGDVKCCFCDSKFSKIANLRQHIKNQHPNMTDEKRRQMNDALKANYTEGVDSEEIHITMLEEEDEEEKAFELSNLDVLNAVDNEELTSPR